MTDVLSDRQLNRATLERQLLLERRRDVSALEAVAHLVGLQAQEQGDPYLALWSRLDGFSPTELSTLVETRAAVRTWVMRGTIHLVTADDALVLWPLLRTMLARQLRAHPDAREIAGEDLVPIVARARSLLDVAPRSPGELADALGGAGYAAAARLLLPLVQTPPRGVWGAGGGVRLAHLETWVGRPVDPTPSLAEVVLRYLRAFGPASVADIATWSRLTALRPVVEQLPLRRFRDSRGHELFDVEDGPLPDPDTPAPVRFLPQYDNVLLSHQDRSRFRAVPTGRHDKGTVLLDGTLSAVWRWERDDLVVHLREPVSKRAWSEIEAEGVRVIAFLGRDGVVRPAPAAG